MTLQNRVDPWGEIAAVPERGTMMGNRGGRFHRADRTLGRRRWASRHWICCDLHYRGMHHEPMGTGYTSLFFLDEVTALAAGHRPCFFCRRAEARTFLGGRRVGGFDRQLHAERLAPRQVVALEGLADGVMVEIAGGAWAMRGPAVLRWSFAGYDGHRPRNDAMRGRLLTPPSIAAILADGYQPRWHPSADHTSELEGDGT
ncbi:MAG: hypothetical protein KDK89_04865 [Alphaproteobacteria bacterium]|nr:hypothetical protein [Alphaproteobacteria bacterium]